MIKISGLLLAPFLMCCLWSCEDDTEPTACDTWAEKVCECDPAYGEQNRCEENLSHNCESNEIGACYTDCGKLDYCVDFEECKAGCSE